MKVVTPSGHVMVSSFGTVLFGLRHGWVWGSTLGAITLAVSTAGVVSNRHLLSQALAGSAVGTIYALAAFKTLKVNHKMTTTTPLSHPHLSH